MLLYIHIKRKQLTYKVQREQEKVQPDKKKKKLVTQDESEFLRFTYSNTKLRILSTQIILYFLLLYSKKKLMDHNLFSTVLK